MLRRPPTVLTLTSEDIKAYEDRREALAFKALTSASAQHRQPSHHPHQQDHHLHHHHHHLANSMSGMDLTSSESNGPGEDEYDDDPFDEDASYYPSRFRSAALGGRPGGEAEEEDSEIYRNAADRSDDSASSPELITGALQGEEEDEVMGDDENDDVRAENYSPNRLNRRQQQQQQPSPPPAPARVTRGTSSRSMSREPQQSSSDHRFARGRGGGGSQAVTPTMPPAGRGLFRAGQTAARDVATTPEAPARATRSRDERIGAPRGGRR